MDNVVRLKRPRKGTIRGAARSCLTEAMAAHPKPNAVLVVVLAADGCFSLRTVSHDDISDFDKFARAEAVLTREKMRLIE